MIGYAAITFEFLLFVYISYLLGTPFLNLLPGSFAESRLKRTTYSIIIGYALFGVVGLALILLGQLNTPTLWAVVLTVVLLARHELKKHLGALRTAFRYNLFSAGANKIRGWMTDLWFLKGVIGIWLFVNFLFAFMPLTGHDTLFYHLPIIDDILRHGTFTFRNEVSNHYSSFPLFGHVLYASPGVLFQNTSPPFVFQLLQYSTLPLILVIIYEFLREAGVSKTLRLAALILTLALMDMEREVLRLGYTDMPALLFGFAGLFLIVSQISRKKFSYAELFAAGIMIGAGMSVKLLGLNFLVISAVLLAACLLIRRARWTQILKYTGALTGSSAAVVSYWYLKNFVAFGNPFYPIFSISGESTAIELFVVNPSITHFFIFPFYRWGLQWFINPAEESSSQLIVAAYFAAVYILLAFFLLKRRGIGSAALSLFAFIELYLLLLFTRSHYTRYLLPAIMALPPLLAILGENLRRFLADYEYKTPYRAALKTMFIGFNLLALILFVGNVRYFKHKFFYLVGRYNQEEYVIKNAGL